MHMLYAVNKTNHTVEGNALTLLKIPCVLMLKCFVDY
jgi:hypothetical protein